ncbi:hypothetical protein ACFLWA_03780 [Chloroflexota bacterium]
MNEQEKRTVVINVDLSRGLGLLLTGGLLVLAAIALVGWTRAPAVATGPQEGQAEASSTTGRRQYYRTWDSYTSTHTIDACAEGYHFASMWELIDPSNLEYNSAMGWTEDDSGRGPPTWRYGWIRTGYNSDGASDILGQVNCDNWTTVDSSKWGTIVSLSWQWGIKEELHVWNVDRNACDIRMPVWCVED